MHLIKYIFLFLSVSIFGQQKIDTKFVKKTLLEANSLVKFDDFETLFYTQGNTLIKSQNSKNTTYSNVQLGEITSVDAYNSLKINVFYKDFNTVVVLDNRLAEITRIDFNILSPFRNITHVSTGNDNTIWLFNQDTQQLEVYDYKNNNTRIQPLQPIEGEVLDLKSNYNFCWLLTKNHIYTYSYFGSLVTKENNMGYTNIAESNENLILLKDNHLFLKLKNDTEIRPIKLPELLINQFFVTNETLYIYDNEYLHQYQLLIN